MSIIVILAAVVLPIYQQSVHQARETVLRDNLTQMRRVIDRYAADKGKLPSSLKELVDAKYLYEIPDDPMTTENEARGEAEWAVEFGADPNLSEEAQGVTNVRSRSGEVSSDGTTRYNEW